MRALTKLVHEEESRDLQDFVFAKFDSAWADAMWAKRTAKLPSQDSADQIVWFALCFLAERAIEQGFEKEGFLETAAKAFDLAAEDDETETEAAAATAGSNVIPTVFRP